MLIHFFFGAFLVGVAMLLFQRTWGQRHNRTEGMSAEAGWAEIERRHYHQQFRRRMLTNGLIGTLGFAIIGGFWITATLAAALFWTGLLLIVGAVLLLASLDMLSSHRHFAHLQQFNRIEEANLRREANRLLRANQEPPSDDDSSLGR